jgi:hypothetical protein
MQFVHFLGQPLPLVYGE